MESAAATAADDRMRQMVLGKYEMGRMLGKGTFAKVYYAKNKSSGESVAIKVMNKEQVKKEGMMEQIQREISVIRLVRHPNAVELKEVMAVAERSPVGSLKRSRVATNLLKAD